MLEATYRNTIVAYTKLIEFADHVIQAIDYDESC